MKLQVFLLLPAFCWGMMKPAISVETREVATVEVLHVAQRSAEEPLTSYQVHINGPEQKLRLNLRSPSYSIFTPDFQYLEASTDPITGEAHFRDATPEKRELARIENNFFTDSDSSAAVSLKRALDGKSFQMNGRINDMSIVHQEDNLHQLVRKSSERSDHSDYVDLNRNVTKGRQSRATTRATPEVFVVWDYANTQQFGGDRNRILDYIGVFFHAINNRYDTASDPKISFRISGVLTISQASSQPYIENNKVSGGYDINEVLDDFGSWAYANSGKTPKYDLAALITGTDMKAKDSSGAYSSGVAGLAFLKGACWNSTYYKQYIGISVTEDRGGYYNGVFSVAHELAHNLGAPHDGDKDASGCSWGDGYIMSYEGWGTKNKFYFSPCSLSLMKGLIDSSEGSCTRTQQSSTQVPISKDNVGDRFSMKELCQKYTKSNDAVPDPETSPDDLCKNLKCRYPIPDRPGWYNIATMNHPPGDNSACGSGGRCINGDCVNATG